MLYRPSASLDQAGYLPIPIQKGERGQKIYREEKKGRPGRGRGNLFPDLLSPSSSFSAPLSIAQQSPGAGYLVFRLGP